MSELKVVKQSDVMWGHWFAEYYPKSETDKVIAEKDAEIAELKQKLEDTKASHYAEMVDAGMRERRLRRALYKACANWADYKSCAMTMAGWPAEKWYEMERKCLKKAEEYK